MTNSRVSKTGQEGVMYFVTLFLGYPRYHLKKIQLLFSLSKPQASQKFLNKSLSFLLFTQNVCHLLRNLYYIHIFFQNDSNFLLEINPSASFFTSSFIFEAWNFSLGCVFRNEQQYRMIGLISQTDLAITEVTQSSCVYILKSQVTNIL